GAEAAQLGGERVRARRQRRQPVVALAVRRCRAHETVLLVARGEGDARQDAAGLILHRAGDLRALRGGASWRQAEGDAYQANNQRCSSHIRLSLTAPVRSTCPAITSSSHQCCELWVDGRAAVGGSTGRGRSVVSETLSRCASSSMRCTLYWPSRRYLRLAITYENTGLVTSAMRAPCAVSSGVSLTAEKNVTCGQAFLRRPVASPPPNGDSPAP